MSSCKDEIKAAVRTVEDWPESGVMFRDIMPLLQDPPKYFEKLSIALCIAIKA